MTLTRRAFFRRAVEGLNAAVEVRAYGVASPKAGTVLVDVIAGPHPVAARLTPTEARRLGTTLYAAAYEAEILSGLR